MPTYQYRCKSCRHDFDIVQSFHDDPLRVCAECGGVLRKVLSASGIIFKGSGYYVNDSRATQTNGASTSDSKPADTATSKESSSDSGGSGNSKSPSKDTATSSTTSGKGDT